MLDLFYSVDIGEAQRGVGNTAAQKTDLSGFMSEADHELARNSISPVTNVSRN